MLSETHTHLFSDDNAGRGGLDLAKAAARRERRQGARRGDPGAARRDARRDAVRERCAARTPRQLLTFLADEHPQTIALVLAHLSPQQSAIVLSGFEQRLQADVAHRIALMERASPDVIRIVERELDRRMSTV